jgi:selenocysteine lyase/cysteine desulfurase
VVSRFDALRRSEFARLDATDSVYLDHTGSALYPASLVSRHAAALLGGVFGNPHSENPTALASTERVELARAAVLRFFDADAAEYCVCFTANATAAIKLVGESFPFMAGSRFVLPADNHNSVNGIREFAARRGARVDYLPLDDELRLLNPARALAPAGMAPSLFAFPAQSNFSGVKHPLELVSHARSRGYAVLLDAAAFAPTQALSLRAVGPDFVTVSFYKMFGYPTGVGALIARRETLARLARPWFAGGTVEFVATGLRPRHVLRSGDVAFEDGTQNFLAVAAVPAGLALLDDIGMDAIAAHVARLTDRLIRQLSCLRHPARGPRIRLYGPTSMEDRGATIAFNVLDPHGHVIPHEHVVHAAAAQHISLRGGCFCNPGAAEAALGFAPQRVQQCLDAMGNDFSLAALAACMDGAPMGAVRASLGIASNDDDVDRLIQFLERMRCGDATS